MIRLHNPKFSLTGFGLTALVSSIVLVLNGVLRQELFSLISAGALIIALTISLASTGLLFILLSANRFHPSDASLNRISFFFQAYRKTEYSADANVPFKKSITAFSSKTPWNQPFSAQGREISRGVYLPRSDAYAFYDVFSFFCVTVPLPEQLFPSAFSIPPRKEASGSRVVGDSRFALPTGTSLFHRSSELVENRLYHPGDDPRKINWKQYAHSGSIILREGELLPPPDTRIAVLFQGMGGRRVSKLDAARHDMLIDRVHWLCEDLLLRGYPLRIVVRDAHAIHGFTQTNIDLHQPNPSALLERLLSYPRLQDPPLRQEDIQTLFPSQSTIFIVTPEKSGPVLPLSFPANTKISLVTGPASATKSSTTSFIAIIKHVFLKSERTCASTKKRNTQLNRFTSTMKENEISAFIL